MTEREIFEAVQGQPVAGRAVLLESLCGTDLALRQRIEALLAAHGQAESFLSKPVNIEATDAYAPPLEPAHSSHQPGTMIAGRYKLLERIGEGGMGTVFMAEQLEPVQRKVAVKLIKPGMDSKAVIARFEAERQALALMDHPNIAKVLDGGMTADRQPFFVMELVKGIPITKYCDDHHLTPQQRLELFIPVCQAVQHAHQKGVIHRDLKPSNVLIALYDGKPVPKVIDFGVAKASGGKLTESTLFTGFGNIVGTLEYMSPEQAELNNLDIDTRSDVYSLGVILYELLTGERPIDSNRLRSAAFTEMLRIIREEEPSKPSTKLSQSENLASISAQRKIEPARLSKLMQGDLDWIVMKALAKERDRRYETANSFAMDIQRYLADEPVLAGPPGTSYRIRKFVKRNQGKVVAAALIFAALLLGMIGTTWGFFRAEERRQEAEQARADESKQREIAEQEKLKAQKAELETLEDYRAATDESIALLIASRPELGPQEKAYLEKVLKRWQAYAQRQGTDARQMSFRAEGHFNVALLLYKLGRLSDARKEYENAIALSKQLHVQLPENRGNQYLLARCECGLGLILYDLHQLKEAHQHYVLAAELLEILVVNEPENARYRSDLATCLGNFAIYLKAIGKKDEAEPLYLRVIALREQLLKENPEEAEYQRRVAHAYNNYSNQLSSCRQFVEAERELKKALELKLKLVQRFPDSFYYRNQLAESHCALGQLLRILKRYDEATVCYQKGLQLLEQLSIDFPAIVQTHVTLGSLHNELGMMWMEVGKFDKAEAELQQGILLHEKLIMKQPDRMNYRIGLAATLCNLGQLQNKARNPKACLKSTEQAVQLLKPIHASQSSSEQVSSFLSKCYIQRAFAWQSLEMPKEEAAERKEQLRYETSEFIPFFTVRLCECYLRAGMIQEAIVAIDGLAAQQKIPEDHRIEVASTYARISQLEATRRDHFEEKALKHLKLAVDKGFHDKAFLDRNPVYANLRERPEFKAILAVIAVEKK